MAEDMDVALSADVPVLDRLPMRAEDGEIRHEFVVVGRTSRVTTGHTRGDGRRAILPVSACDINASVRAYI